MKIGLLIICLLLNGCTFYKHTVLTAKGDKLSVPIAGLMVGKGDKVDLKLDRTVCIGGCNEFIH